MVLTIHNPSHGQSRYTLHNSHPRARYRLPCVHVDIRLKLIVRLAVSKQIKYSIHNFSTQFDSNIKKLKEGSSLHLCNDNIDFWHINVCCARFQTFLIFSIFYKFQYTSMSCCDNSYLYDIYMPLCILVLRLKSRMHKLVTPTLVQSLSLTKSLQSTS